MSPADRDAAVAGVADAARHASNALFTDLYELTMARAYMEHGMEETAVFSLFVRKLPEARNLLIACGLDALLDDLEALRFGRADLDYLAGLGGQFPDAFLRRLEDFRFTGEVRAVPEGTPVFANEPILEVTAPLPEAQLVETLAMNRIAGPTVLASKGLRIARAAEGRPVADFGGRRAHGLGAAVEGARAFHVAGIASTSNLMAGQRHGVPVSGTMAHSLVEACDSERAAFRRFAETFPGTTLLVDTYDTLEGVRRVVDLIRQDGIEVGAVRLDSGDLAALSRETRAILDAAGLGSVKIVVSGGLDERAIAALLAGGAPVDGFGVGTAMAVSEDAPALDIVYKLVEYAGRGRLKLSSGKRTLPGRKQVFRRFRDGRATGDVIGREGETLEGIGLLAPVMREGRRLAPREPVAEIRARCREAVAALPGPVLGLDAADPPYPVEVSAALAAHEAEVREAISGGA